MVLLTSMSTSRGVSCTLTNLIRVARREARELGLWLGLSLMAVSHECETAAAVRSLGSAETKLSVAAKSVSIVHSTGEIENPVEQSRV